MVGPHIGVQVYRYKEHKMSDNSCKLSDEAIGQIAKLLQMAILTGTDVVDNLRTLRLTNENGVLVVDSAYTSQFLENLDNMVGEAEGLTNDKDNEDLLN